MADTRTAAADRARTPLLTLITAEAVEQDYQDAAARRLARSDEPRVVSRTGVVVVVVAFGLLVAVAAAQTTRNADVHDASRAQIISRIESNRQALQADQAQLADLREENASAESELASLTRDLGDQQSAVTELAAVTGFLAVTGEGIRIRFDNAPESNPASEWVRDSDVALLVNGLWAAGAEAISVNGQRITGVGGVRNVGNVVEVNSQAIAPPYTVLAIGNSDTLAADLLNSASGGEFFTLAAQYGWDPQTQTVPELRIPAAPPDLRRLRSAQHVGPDRKGGTPQ